MPSILDETLQHETLVSHFQPIISVKRKLCIAAQGLARARNLESGAPVSPVQLFEWAEHEGLSLELDRLCRRKALEGFAQLKRGNEDLLLFMKFHGSVLDQGVLGSDAVLNAVTALGLNPGSIVIEINDSEVRDLASLRAFVERYRGLGFLIAVDDLDEGHSNLKRLALLKPDIIKLGRAMVKDLESDFIQREIFKSLISLARRIGALVMADGVETEAEAAICMELEVDLFKGFYFSKPVEAGAWDTASLQKIIDRCALIHKSAVVDEALESEDQSLKHRSLMLTLAAKLARAQPDTFDYVLTGQVTREEDIECLYVLDRFGWQLTGTLTMPSLRSRTRGLLFKPAPRGTDHSLKDYYCGLVDAKRVRYVTEPYISMASGNLCRTISCMVRGQNEKDYVLCMDIKAGL